MRATMMPVLILAAQLVIASFANGQPEGRQSSAIREHARKASILKINGRCYAECPASARSTRGSLFWDGARIVLIGAPAAQQSISPPHTSKHVDNTFSRNFASAAIDALAALREWVSTLASALENSYPLGNAIDIYQGRASDAVRRASTAVSTDGDRSGFHLLTTEFENVQKWSATSVQARNSLSATNMAISDDALKNDPSYQKIVRCEQSLGNMYSHGEFHDDPACH